MGRGVNKVILLGSLGRDPETTVMANGKTVTKVSIATSEQWKDKTSGERVEKAEWHNLTFFSPLSDIAAKYLKKGSKIYIEGSLKTDSWDDKESGAKRYKTHIVVRDMVMLGDKIEGSSQPKQQMMTQQGAAGTSRPAPPAMTGAFDDDSDIPF